MSGNLEGGITGAMVQFPPDAPLRGHYVSFQRDDAKAVYACFLDTLGGGSPPVIMADAEAMATCPNPFAR